MQAKGIQSIQWDVVGGDGFNMSTENIVHNVIDNVQNGSIIVLHMNGFPNDPKTTEALPEIIATLKNRGYEFVTLSKLLE
jgi:peptidoglycan/xylan/chitin deacetylase (PgdA/CDA1 family)